MDADGISLAIGGGAVVAIANVVASIIKARWAKTRIDPQPLAVRLDERYADKDGNTRAHENLFARVSALERETGELKAGIAQLQISVNQILSILLNKSAK